MINKIYTNPINSYNRYNAPNKSNKNEPAFGVAYNLADKWYQPVQETIESAMLGALKKYAEQTIKQSVAALKSLKFLGRKGDSYLLKTKEGTILYTPEAIGIKSNLKYVSDKNPNSGFYIIDDPNQKNIHSQHSELANLLNSIIGKTAVKKEKILYYRDSNSQTRKWENSMERAARGAA